MTHLYIELNGITEEVSSSVISKLYELASSGTLDGTSNLKGRLHTTLGYRSEIEYLNTNYQDLYISVDDFAIPFEDPNMVTYLNSIGVGSNGMITENLAAAATIVANSLNTTVTKFNELRYFTSITLSRGGLNGILSGWARFINWTALEEIDISNFTSLGHANGAAYEDTFNGCTSLKKVTASDKLEAVGNNAFYNCNLLKDITGLSGNITLYSNSCFNRCEKLKQSSFDNVTFIADDNKTGTNIFERCHLLTSLSLSGNFTLVKSSWFNRCGALTSISGLSNVTEIGYVAFLECLNLTTIDIDWTKITSIGQEAFRNCYNLFISTLSIPLLTQLGIYSFARTKIQSVSNLGLITEIPNNCFEACSELTSVTLPNTITKLGNNCFWYDSSLLSINIPTSCTTLGAGAFCGCTSLSETFDLSAVTTVGEQLFMGDTNVSISSFPRVSEYSANAFKQIANTSITIPKEVTRIKNSCFQQCGSLLTLTFEQNSQLTQIDGTAFYGCNSLLSLVLPEGLTTIGDQVFRECSKLYNLDIPSTVTTIGNTAFYLIGGHDNYTNMTTVIFRGTTPPTCSSTSSNMFGRNNVLLSNLSIYVPDASIQAYKSATWLSYYESRIFGISQMPNS